MNGEQWASGEHDINDEGGSGSCNISANFCDLVILGVICGKSIIQ